MIVQLDNEEQQIYYDDFELLPSSFDFIKNFIRRGTVNFHGKRIKTFVFWKHLRKEQCL